MQARDIQRSPNHSITAAEGANVNRTAIEISDRSLSIFAFGFAVAAFVTALWGIHESDFTRRHTEELRIRLEDAQAAMLQANCIKPGDALHGPLANPDRLKEK